MNVLIIEDELGAAKNLQAILKELDTDINVVAVIETVKDAVTWIKNNPTPEIAFFDIQLADAISFEIFDKVKIEFPVVFTTAFDQYAIKAFKVNSVDYLLKPIRKKDLEAALQKYHKLYTAKDSLYFKNLANLISDLVLDKKRETKKTFLIHYRDKILPIAVSDFAYFFIKNTIVFGITFQNEKYTLDGNLESIEGELGSEDFFRINRQFIVARKAIKEAIQHFNGRLKLNIAPKSDEDFYTSKSRTAEFKKWWGL